MRQAYLRHQQQYVCIHATDTDICHKVIENGKELTFPGPVKNFHQYVLIPADEYMAAKRKIEERERELRTKAKVLSDFFEFLFSKKSKR